MQSSRVAVTLYWAAGLAVTAMLMLHLQQVVAPQRNGPLALAQIGAPHLTLLCLFALPLVFARVTGQPSLRVARRWLRVALVAGLAVGVVRFGPGLVSFPMASVTGASELTLTSWNLYFGQPSDVTVTGVLRDARTDLIGLQELRPPHAGLLATDPVLRETHPHRILLPDAGTLGVGLLSRYPMLESGALTTPPTVWARIPFPATGSVLVVVSHPLPGRIRFAGPLPIGFDATERDEAIRELRRSLIDPALTRGERVILVGDFNVTDREPAYGDLSAGLRDAHAEVGVGPGSTWRPDRLAWLPAGLLRIDLVLTGPGVQPTAISTDCTPRGSDHCIVQARVSF